MKAAARLVDRLRQAGATLTLSPIGRVQFAAPAPLPAALLAEARAHRDGIAAELATEGPPGPCEACGGGQWWRLSVLSGGPGPGPWHCHHCDHPNPANWVDACSIPTKARGRERT